MGQVPDFIPFHVGLDNATNEWATIECRRKTECDEKIVNATMIHATIKIVDATLGVTIGQRADGKVGRIGRDTCHGTGM